MFRHKTAFVSALLLIVMAVSHADADESRIPLYAPAITSKTIDIDKPGSYVLTRNFTSTADPVIKVLADDVSIDLNGRTITNTGVGATIQMNGHNNLSVINGSIVGGEEGIYIDQSEPQLAFVRLRDLSIRNVAVGAYLMHVNIEMQSCRFDNLNPAGISPQSQFAVYLHGTGSLVGNTITAAKMGGVRLGTAGVEFRNNVINDFNQLQNGFSGVQIGFGSGNFVSGNTIGNGENGLGLDILTPNNTVANNTIYLVEDGIKIVSSGNLISENNVRTDLGGFGIHVDGAGIPFNLLEGNVVEGFSVGIHFDSGAANNAFRNNMLRGNTNPVNNPGAVNTDAGGNIY